MVKSFFKRLFGDPDARTISRLQKIVQQINDLEPAFKALSDDALLAKTQVFRERLQQGVGTEGLSATPSFSRSAWAAPSMTMWPVSSMARCQGPVLAKCARENRMCEQHSRLCYELIWTLCFGPDANFIWEKLASGSQRNGFAQQGHITRGAKE